ncbi:MAG: hypothetical protein IKN73_00785 [Alphaproteobacteria bacterium]|nr:hypothetical protein [Alphaproteobacteria bacterium]
MKYIRKILSVLLICLITASLFNTSFAETNTPYGEIAEYGDWIIEENMETYSNSMQSDIEKYNIKFQENIKKPGFVPIETKLGLMFMQAMSPIGEVLQKTLVPFTIVFLFIMYAFWIGLNAYKMIRESTDYKTVFYEVFKKGLIIVVWVLILNSKPEEIFELIVTPILSLGTYISTFIIDSVSNVYNSNIANVDTCAAIKDYVTNNMSGHLLIGDAKAAADIMCLPGRLSTFFYYAIGSAFDWIKYGLKLGNSITATIVGIVALYIFIKCIFKYAFMTLGVVADLFFTILMLPFTALAESMPSISEKNYAGQIFSGLLKVFNTKKLSDIINTFINATIYFVSLSIVIAICSVLLTFIISDNQNNGFEVGSAMVILITGCLILHLADKTDEYATQLGGKIDNAFGKQLQSDTKTLWGDIKGFGGKVVKAWSKDKL